MRTNHLVFLLLTIGAALSAISVNAQPYAYVTNAGSTVSVIDTATNTVIDTIKVGDHPESIAATPNGAYVYVTNLDSGNVSVIETATNTVVATIVVDSMPAGIAITPDGAYAYVTHHTGSQSVSVIETATNTVVDTAKVGNFPYGVAISPNGAFAYVVNQGPDNVSVIDTTTNAVVATVGVGVNPLELTITPDGACIYVANFDNVSVINATTNAVTATVSGLSTPRGMTVTADGAFVYVTSSASTAVSVIDTATNTIVDAIEVGSPQSSIAIAPDGANAYVTNWGIGYVSVIDTATNTAVDIVDGINYGGDVAIVPTLPTYSLIGVGSNGSNAMAVNDLGQVVGTYGTNSSSAPYEAYIWQQGTGMVSTGINGSSGFDTLGGSYTFTGASFGYDINNNGQITGYAEGDIRCCADVTIPYIWNPDGSVDVFPAYGVDGWQTGPGNAINDSGHVAGDQQRHIPGGLTHEGFIWDGATNIIGVGHLDSFWSEARDINNLGAAVGVSANKAFLWDSITGMQGLGELTPGYASIANAINEGGTIVGSSENTQYLTEATLWNAPNDHIGLGDLSGGVFYSEALDINDSGAVVGWGTTTIGKEAFYRDPQTGIMHLLLDLVDTTGNGWTLLEAAGISDTGFIAGTGINPNGHQEGYILVPASISIPPAFWLKVTGTADGGTVFLTVAGVELSVFIETGSSPRQVVHAMTETINTDETLIGMGITAWAKIDTLYTNGVLTHISTTDSGLTLTQGLGKLADGDINLDGLVNVADILVGLQVLTGTSTLEPFQMVHADVAPLFSSRPKPDGLFTLGDLLVIERKVLGLINF